MSGDILKKRREELGLEIRQVADELRIRADYLSSIEQDLFDKLPAPVYTMGYIRSYARHLDVDPTAILEVYAQRLPKPKTDTPAIPVVLAEKKKPFFLYLILAVAAAAIGSGVYVRLPHAPVQKQIEKTETLTEVRPHKIEKQLVPSKEKAVSGIKTKTEVTPQLPENQKAAAAPSEPAAVGPDRHSAKQLASDHSMHLLSIHAVETSWIYVKFKSGKYESLTLRTGSSKQWNFSDSAFLKIGNAGGLKLMLDGREIGPAGQSGQVVALTLP